MTTRAKKGMMLGFHDDRAYPATNEELAYKRAAIKPATGCNQVLANHQIKMMVRREMMATITAGPIGEKPDSRRAGTIK